MRLLALAAALAVLSLAAPSAAAQTPDAALQVRLDSQPVFESLMRLNIDGGFHIGGTYDSGAGSFRIPVEGAGTRLMWHPAKGAFRAGGISGTQWDDANIGNYSLAIGENVRASGDYGVAFGLNTTAANIYSFAVGDGNTASGASSVALGYHAHTNARTGSFVFADRSSVDEVRAGNAHQATFRTACGFRIYTSSNLSTGVAFGGASVSNLGSLCPSEYFGQSGTMIATSTGAYLSSGGTWVNSSDAARKHRFADVSGEDVLARLRAMPVRTWSYRAEGDGLRHMGPTAQDFHAAFGLGGEDSTHIATVDADGVALAAVQALEARTRTLADENAALRARLDALEADRRTPAQAALPVVGVLMLLGLAAVGAYRQRSATAASR
ncbi:MAG TPA: tail fiber domain-containing protein [Rubricoccaceae bacterium]|jgi:hypothetical protein